jgi:biotin carboxyl carrier protein
MKFVIRINGSRFELDGTEDNGLHRIILETLSGDIPTGMKKARGRENTVYLDHGKRALRTAEVNNERVTFGWIRRDDGYTINIAGRNYDIEFIDPRLEALKALLPEKALAGGKAEIQAPIPGLVKEVLVQVGDAVDKDQTVCILDAMKLENEIPSPKAGVITAIAVKAGQSVDKGELLVVVE